MLKQCSTLPIAKHVDDSEKVIHIAVKSYPHVVDKKLSTWSVVKVGARDSLAPIECYGNSPSMTIKISKYAAAKQWYAMVFFCSLLMFV